MTSVQPDVVIGRIVRPHGNRGDVVVEPLTDFGAARFGAGAALAAVQGDRDFTLTIRRSRPYGDRWVLGFDGVASIDDAEALRGVELRIADDELTPLPEGAYYRHELVGCRVVGMGGEDVGMVTRIDESGGAALLLVVETAGGEVLVPFADSICREVDVAARRIVIAPPAGLLELNRTGKA